MASLASMIAVNAALSTSAQANPGAKEAVEFCREYTQHYPMSMGECIKLYREGF